jgi:hypothetical protein
VLVQVCPPDQFDASTQACAGPVWVEYAGGLPPLSATDGAQISAAIVGVWAIGWAIRQCVRVMRR